MKEKIFCFPHAGGSSTLYERNLQGLMEDFDIIPIDYAGHGTKFGMPLNETMESLLKEVYGEITAKLSKNESYCLFGYSLGSIIAYEIACLLRENGYKIPRMMFLCSMEAPHEIPKEEWYHTLSDDEFVKEMLDKGGIDAELVSDPLMMEIFMPMIRADFKLNELYKVKEREILDTKALVMYSSEDISDEKIHDWDKFIADVEYICYPGGHFFIYQNSLEVVKEVLKRK